MFAVRNNRPRVQSRHFLLPVIAIVALNACATSPQGRNQLSPAAPVINIYSDVDMRVHLATMANATCLGAECALNREFDQQVQQLGTRLARLAYDAHPDLIKRVSQFDFVVAEKEKPGTASNASGKIVIFRGVQQLHLDEEALAFLIAREMGHVICGHHDKNSSVKILVSVLASVLFPALNLFNGSAALAQATSATTSATTFAASSATSYLGSEVVVASIKPGQLSEADTVALDLLAGLGWNKRDVAGILEVCTQVDGDDTWSKDFRNSVSNVKALEGKSEVAAVNLKAGMDGLLIADDAAGETSTDEATAIDPMVENTEVALNGESGQNPGEGIESADTVVEAVAETSDIAANPSRENIQPENTKIAAESSPGFNLNDSHTDGAEKAKNDLKENHAPENARDTAHTVATITTNSGNVKVAAVKKATSGGSKQAVSKTSTQVMAKNDVESLKAKGTKKQTPKGIKASAKLAKKPQLPGGVTKITSRGSNVGKVVTRAAKSEPPKTTVARKQENIKTAQVRKGPESESGTDGIRKDKKVSSRSNAKPVEATSGQAKDRTITAANKKSKLPNPEEND